MVGELVGGNREEPTFQRPPGVVVRQARKKPDEGFLHDVFAGIATSETAFDKGEQTPFVLGDQLVPRGGLAPANLFDEQDGGLGGIIH